MHRIAWLVFVAFGTLGCGRDDGVASAPAGQAAPCCEIDRTQVAALLAQATPVSGDWSMFGGTPERNMVNLVDKNIPAEWSIEEGKRKNIKWVAELGTKAYGGPVIGDGKIFVGTNNGNPRDAKVKGVRAVLMAFNEADGKFLWQIAHDYPPDDLFREAIPFGLFSAPAIEGRRLYYVTPGAEVICADTDGKIVWRYDMMKQLKVVPYHCANCSPLVAGDLVLVVTGNGTGEDGKVVSPKAPSFVALNKTSGKVVWQSDLSSAGTIEGQWSNPALARVNGKDIAIFPGGDAYLYGLELATGKLIWKFNCQPERAGKDEDRPVPNYMVATPVVHDSKVYIGLGVQPEHPSGPPFSHVLCVDITKTGDVSPKTLNHKDAKNTGSALVWSYGGKIEPVPKKGRRILFGRTISTCAVHDGLVYIGEETGYMHCLDAKTGQKYWDYDFKAGVWGSTFFVDGKVYIGTEDGEVVVFKHGKTCEVIAKNDLAETVHSTPVVARGVLYVVTKSRLYAIAEPK
jgi:outer membrane protein assembly factor BamB